jgi:cytochrome c-type biogenesis protein CcmE
MDPSRKRVIRLTLALTAALLLASALVYTSFSAGREELTASQLVQKAKPGQSYVLAGTVVDGSVHRAGSILFFRVRDPKLHLSVPVRYSGIVPDPFQQGRGVLVTVHEQGPRFIGERRGVTWR